MLSNPAANDTWKTMAKSRAGSSAKYSLNWVPCRDAYRPASRTQNIVDMGMHSRNSLNVTYTECAT
ncbi:hypothetical protein D3C76_1871520 [compost metagenome]